MTDDTPRPAAAPPDVPDTDAAVIASAELYAARAHWKEVARNEAVWEFNRNDRLRRILVTCTAPDGDSALFTFICDSGGHIALLDDAD